MRAKIFLTALTVLLAGSTSRAVEYKFTSGTHWDSGTYSSTNSLPNPPGTALRLDANTVTPFNHIWVSLAGRNSVVRIDTDLMNRKLSLRPLVEVVAHEKGSFRNINIVAIAVVDVETGWDNGYRSRPLGRNFLLSDFSGLSNAPKS